MPNTPVVCQACGYPHPPVNHNCLSPVHPHIWEYAYTDGPFVLFVSKIDRERWCAVKDNTLNPERSTDAVICTAIGVSSGENMITELRAIQEQKYHKLNRENERNGNPWVRYTYKSEDVKRVVLECEALEPLRKYSAQVGVLVAHRRDTYTAKRVQTPTLLRQLAHGYNGVWIEAKERDFPGTRLIERDKFGGVLPNMGVKQASFSHTQATEKKMLTQVEALRRVMSRK